ncbi:MAG: 4Fe-4S dicluster domain-containing protein [Deltaproteobacteria bacterium]|nr:4Fe-4S dicluster domain-containing protein [Deltaproteobacteria bacterium]
MSSAGARGARIWAYVVLAFGLVAHLVKRIFHRGDGGLAKFNAHYSADRLLPSSPEDLVLYATASRCINCGICDALCPVTSTAPRHEFAGPSMAPLLLSRSASLAAFAAPFLKHSARCESCGECQHVCPTSVPIASVIRLVRRRAERLGRAVNK